MQLKSFKTIQVLYVVVSLSALLTACHTKITEPLKSMSKSDFGTLVENYAVPQAQSVQFSQNASESSVDLTY
jgi:hypothetical protein